MSRTIENIVKTDWIEATKVISSLKRSGKLFRVDFEKRSDSETRSMVCRFGVKSELRGYGGARKINPDTNLLVVYEPFVGYRSIPMEGITFIKTDGVLYDFRGLNTTATRYPAPKISSKTKRLPVVGW